MGSKAHIAAQERYIGFTNPKVAIDYNIEKWSDEDRCLYKKRLTYSLRCIKGWRFVDMMKVKNLATAETSLNF